MTPKQVARREKFTKLRNIITKMTPEEKTDFLVNAGGVTTCEGRVLSGYNAMLLMLQAPVTVVGGYRQWQKAGRQVIKGQHGLMIYFPAKQTDEDKREEKPRFFIGTVFDITQTEEQPAQSC